LGLGGMWWLCVCVLRISDYTVEGRHSTDKGGKTGRRDSPAPNLSMLPPGHPPGPPPPPKETADWKRLEVVIDCTIFYAGIGGCSHVIRSWQVDQVRNLRHVAHDRPRRVRSHAKTYYPSAPLARRSDLHA